MKNLKSANRAFTLIEIMIVVLIIGILLAIAVPNFIRAREQSRAKACSSNLRQIDSAEEQWAMDTRAAQGAAAPATTALYGANLYIKVAPLCPSSGTYTIGAVGVAPVCTLATAAPYNTGGTFPHTVNGL